MSPSAAIPGWRTRTSPMRWAPLLAALVLAAGCTCEGARTAQARLEEAAGRALARGEPHLAYLLVLKAAGQGEPAASAWLLAARGAARSGDLGGAHEALIRAADAGLSDLTGVRAAPELAPLRADGAFAWLEARVAANAAHRAPKVGSGLLPSTPEREGIDPEALKQLLKDAERTHSSAVVLLRHGRLVGQWYFGGKTRRIEAMSATKSVVSLAAGLLIKDGKLRSVDQRVSDFFPEWRGTPKEVITVGELLNQTSGLKSFRTTEKIYASPDFLRYALSQPLADPPGTRWTYNNSACNLLAGVIARAAGEPLEVYLQHRLFGPLGIEDVTWSWDRVGNRHGMSGLQLHPLDFAKLGQLLLERGRWAGQEVVPAEWIDASTRPHLASEWDYGYLWWLIPQRAGIALDPGFFQTLRAHGVSESVVRALLPLQGQQVDLSELGTVLRDRLKPFQLRQLQDRGHDAFRDHLRGSAKSVGYAAEGYRGQYLFVDPAAELVAVRMTDDQDHPDAEVTFHGFIADVRRLVEPGTPSVHALDPKLTAPGTL